MRRSERLRGSDRRGRSAARVLTLVSSAVLVLAGCAAEAPEAAAPPPSTTPPSPAPVRTSGPLANGFEIEPGSGLMGAVFPLSAGEGRQAVLRVDGDGPAVFEGYVRQMEELGYATQSDHCCRGDEQWCNDPDDEWTEDDPTGPYPFACATYGSGDGDFVALRGFLAADGIGWIHFRTSERLPSDELPPPLPELPDGPVAPATDVEIAPDLTPQHEDPLRVVEGSALVAEPIPSECLTGGYLAVIQVTGDLLPVMRGYGAQFDAAGFGRGEVVGAEDEPRVEGGQAGGGILSAVGVAGDPSHVLVERCND